MVYNQLMGLMARALMIASAMLIASSAAVCAEDAAPNSAHLNMERIEKAGVDAGPWAASWSPEGDCISYITNASRLHVLCLSDGKSEPWDIKAKGAEAVSWTGEGLVLITRGPKGRAALARVDIAGRKLGEPEPLPDHASMVYDGRRGKLALVTWFSELSIGVNVFSEVHALRDGAWEVAFKAGRLSPLSVKGMDFIKGWMRCGPNPFDGSFLLSEYIDPPALNSYMKVVLVDGMDYSRTDIFRSASGPISLECSWSPSGQRAALADLEGNLRMLDLDGRYEALRDGASGCCPSWSPSGEHIYFGGSLVHPSGAESTDLLADASGSRSWWSGRSDALAIANEGALYLVRNIGQGGDGKISAMDAPVGDELRGKVRLLRELADEGLISMDEYRQRIGKLRRLHVGGESDGK